MYSIYYRSVTVYLPIYIPIYPSIHAYRRHMCASVFTIVGENKQCAVENSTVTSQVSPSRIEPVIKILAFTSTSWRGESLGLLGRKSFKVTWCITGWSCDTKLLPCPILKVNTNRTFTCPLWERLIRVALYQSNEKGGRGAICPSPHDLPCLSRLCALDHPSEWPWVRKLDVPLKIEKLDAFVPS